MSATDELREGLRKRGESWHKWPDEDSTTWQAYSDPHTATESMDGTLIVTGLTPAQAIAATLGAWTCHEVLGFDGTAWICSECGEHIGPRRWNYCPNCGRRIEVER